MIRYAIIQEKGVTLQKNMAQQRARIKTLWDYYKNDVLNIHSRRSLWHRVFTLISAR
jgi:hypothetical protein